ncbi:MAG: sugar phosphate nucleotidyltransferase [bacterium]|nr:sugar phosphate nucleotidyltransferase [bacterium]
MKRPKAVILAGGIGKPFKPLSTNKTLIPFLGKPLLQHVIEMLEASGIHEALIVTNEDNESWLSTYQPFNITLHTKRVHPNGMGDALLQAELEIGSDPILILNASDMIDPAFVRMYLRALEGNDACVAGLKVDTYFPGGYLKTNGDRAMGIVEKPGAGNEPSDLINLVFHYFERPAEFMALLRHTDVADDQYEQALSDYMQQKKVHVVTYEGPWAKLKYAHHVLDMMQFMLRMVKKHVGRSAQISENAIIEGEVYIDEGARIDDYAVIKGPAYIGVDVHIGNHSLVRQSTVEKGATVGFGTEVARSYIGPNCALHHNFVGDSVLEANVNPSFGTTFTNWRLDNSPVKVKMGDELLETGREKLGAIVAKGAFLGVNCSVMPGVTIGENARIHPATIVNRAVSKDEVVK